MADEVIIESDDSFLQKKLPKYAGGKTLEERVKELNLPPPKPRPLPSRERDD